MRLLSNIHVQRTDAFTHQYLDRWWVVAFLVSMAIGNLSLLIIILYYAYICCMTSVFAQELIGSVRGNKMYTLSHVLEWHFVYIFALVSIRHCLQSLSLAA